MPIQVERVIKQTVYDTIISIVLIHYGDISVILRDV